MRRILRSKRGVAIEGAILFVVVLMTFSILMTTVVMTAHSRANLAERQMNDRLALEQIGEYFISGTLNDSDFADYYRVATDANTLHLKKSESGRTVLYIEKLGNVATVWRYSPPTQ